MRNYLLHAALMLAVIPSTAHAEVEVGDDFEIRRSYSTKSEAEGSSGSSSGQTTYIERVLSTGPDGVLLEYSLPQEREEPVLADWHFPVQILRLGENPPVIANVSELEARRDKWLAEAQIPLEACGSWYFTWNAFQVDCDPQSVLQTVAALAIQPAALAPGAMVHEEFTLEASRLALLERSGEGAVWSADFAIDPDAVRRSRSESDVVVGQILGEPISYDEALAKRQDDEISGTVTVKFAVNADGRVTSKTVESVILYKKPDEPEEVSRGTYVTTRTKVDLD